MARWDNLDTELEIATTAPVNVGRLDWFEREMIELLLSWAPYGDPPEEECLPRFGKTVRQLKLHVYALARRPCRCDADALALLMRVAKLIGPIAPGRPPPTGPLRQPRAVSTEEISASAPPAAYRSATGRR